MSEDFDWALTEQIDVTQTAENTYRINRVTQDGELILTIKREAPPGRTLLFNGEFVDVGDDFISYLSILDDYHEQNGGEMGQTIRQQPFDDQNS
jgi:hypothetical protein